MRDATSSSFVATPRRSSVPRLSESHPYQSLLDPSPSGFHWFTILSPRIYVLESNLPISSYPCPAVMHTLNNQRRGTVLAIGYQYSLSRVFSTSFVAHVRHPNLPSRCPIHPLSLLSPDSDPLFRVSSAPCSSPNYVSVSEDRFLFRYPILSARRNRILRSVQKGREDAFHEAANSDSPDLNSRLTKRCLCVCVCVCLENVTENDREREKEGSRQSHFPREAQRVSEGKRESRRIATIVTN